jgi:hypothetical protein
MVPVQHIWIMATVLAASLLPSPLDNGDLSVTITNSFSGQNVCGFLLPGGTCGTLADLEKILCNPHGPMSRSCPSSRLLFYSEAEPLMDLQLQLGDFDSLVIKHGDMGAWLHTFPDTGKFLEAMRINKFYPRAPDFDRAWTAKSAPAVTAARAERLVHEVLSGSVLHERGGVHFVQIFGKLTALGEQWGMLNLAELQCFDPGLKTFKHSVFQHWLELARGAATSMVSASAATPIVLLKRAQSGFVDGGGLIGDAWPGGFDRHSQSSLQLNDLSPNLLWRNVSHSLLSLDWNPQEGLASLRSLLNKIEEEPCEFAALQYPEVSQMVQVQLRLSCCGVAEVEGSINEACVKILAELLDYKLKILKFQSVLDLKTQMSDLRGDSNHRGTLVLVTDLPASEGHIGHIFAGPHRMVLCYSARE